MPPVHQSQFDLPSFSDSLVTKAPPVTRAALTHQFTGLNSPVPVFTTP